MMVGLIELPISLPQRPWPRQAKQLSSDKFLSAALRKRRANCESCSVADLTANVLDGCYIAMKPEYHSLGMFETFGHTSVG